MDSKTVAQLKAEAKNLGLRNYSRLRKQELIDLINQPRGADTTKVAKPTPVTRPIPAPRTKVVEQIPTPVTRPIPAPRTKVVKQIPTPVTRPIPAPRTKVAKPTPPIPAPRTKVAKPTPAIPAPRTKVVPSHNHLQLSTNNSKTKRQKREFARLKKKLNRAKNKKPLQQKLEKFVKKLQPKKEKEAPPKVEFIQRAKALKGYTVSYEVSLINKLDPLIQLQSTRLAIEENLKKILNEMRGFKFNEVLKITFQKQKGDEFIEKTAFFNGKVQKILNETEIAESLKITQNQITNKIQQWISEGSAWLIQSVNSHFINLVKYQPLRGSSYIPLPKELQNSAKGIINIKNNDNECFRWCHIRQLNPQKKDPQRVKLCDREFVKNLDYSGIDFFGYEKKQPYPIYVSKEKFETRLNLLLITEDEVKHYCLIKDFNKFMFRQTKHKCRKHFCMYCLQCFSTESILEKHKVDCIEINGTQSIKMPKPGTKIFFKNYSKQLPAPFVIYADFEAITEKIPDPQGDDQEKRPNTEQYQKHIDCGYGYKVVCCYDEEFSKPIKIYRGKKAVHKFMEDMLDEVKWCQNIVKKHFSKPLKMSKEDQESFERAKECHICKKPYTEGDVRVRDHCHIYGNYRGSAHQDCNLNFKITSKIPVVFHNLKGYDSHFIMQEIGEIVKKNSYVDEEGKKHEMDINVIPNNMEKYMAFMLGYNLLFIDSFQFMSLSLEKLVKNLPADAFKYTGQVFQKKEFEFMTKKGVYPYDYMDSFEKFEETKLPNKEDFFSILNNKGISDEDYQHAQNVWNEFSLSSMGAYHDLYLKSDILLLADVFENFRKTCRKNYGLDPPHYFTSPGLSWDAMLKMMGIELELMSDVDMFQFIEKGMRGGISYIANRYGKANNKYMKEYDDKAPSKYLMYLDANNLYGWAMSQYLPTGGFQWLKDEEIDKVDLAKYNDESKKGLILEVDLEYPEELHSLHNDYPLAAEKVKVTEDMLSDYCREIAEKFSIKTGMVYKLIPTLATKEKYVLHYRNLQLYLSLGLKLKKVHRVLKFNQSPWLKKYIDLNTQKRMGAKNSFEKDFFKLMNNSVFGKTMENLRKRENIKLVTDKEKLLKLASKPSFISCKIFNEDLVAVHKIKPTLLLNRPAYVGMCILDLSKTLMYDFHYNYIKKKYPDARLLFTDTDSLTYEIEANDVYHDFWQDRHLFDNSDYPESSPFFDKANKKVIGKFKDESPQIPIVEFVGLGSKMYSYVKDNKKEASRAKGIKESVKEQELRHENFKDVLFNGKQMSHTMRVIKSKEHQVGSYVLNKTSLSCFDDKRYILSNGVTSYAYGHKDI